MQIIYKPILDTLKKMVEKKTLLSEKKLKVHEFPERKILDVPTVISVIDTGFPADENYTNRLHDMAVTDDNKVWMRGHSKELKLFDLQGNISHTVSISCTAMFICMHNKQVALCTVI